MSLFLFISISTYIISKRKINSIKKEEIDFDDPQHFFITIFSILTCVVSLGFLCERIYYLTFILVSPKLYLIEYFIK